MSYLEDIAHPIQTETTEPDACGMNGSNDPFSYISYLFDEAKFNQLKKDITSGLKVEIKELVEQNCKEIKSDLLSHLGNWQVEVISVLLD